MHTPEKWNMGSIEKKHKFINEFGFAAIISKDLEASHLPLLLFPNESKNGVLYGHFSRTNPHWKSIVNSEVLVIFTGPHSYISPSWYATKPAVPTWNYSAVHATGVIELTDDEITSHILQETINKYEPSLLARGAIPDDFKAKLAKGIVGFKITISQLQGKEKLGQHRSLEDQLGVYSALAKTTSLEGKQLYQYMQNNNIGTGS